METPTKRREYLIEKNKEKKKKEERNDRRRNRCVKSQIALQVNLTLGYMAMTLV